MTESEFMKQRDVEYVASLRKQSERARRAAKASEVLALVFWGIATLIFMFGGFSFVAMLGGDAPFWSVLLIFGSGAIMVSNGYVQRATARRTAVTAASLEESARTYRLALEERERNA